MVRSRVLFSRIRNSSSCNDGIRPKRPAPIILACSSPTLPISGQQIVRLKKKQSFINFSFSFLKLSFFFQVSKAQLKLASNTNDFDMDGIRSQILQAFRSSTRSDFQVTLKLADDFSNASVRICVCVCVFFFDFKLLLFVAFS